MSSDSEMTYGRSTDWQPDRPPLRVFPLVVSWRHYPSHLELLPGAILRAVSVHGILAGWRETIHGGLVAEVPAV